MAITINKELNVVSTGVPPVIHLSQYDSDFSLVFSLYASSGTLTMPNGTTAEIRGTKRDGNGYSASASVSGTTVTVTGDEQITACAGRNTFEIATYYNSKRLYTANFIIDVERAALDADTITSDTVLRELDAIIEGAEVAQEAAEAAEHSAAEAAAVVQSGIAITALQLMSSNYTSDSTPYLYRTTGGGVAVGTRELDEIVGGSVGWNQLARFPNGTSTVSGVTYTVTDYNKVAMSNTATADSILRGYTVSGFANHVYFVSGGKSNNIYVTATSSSNWARSPIDYGGGSIGKLNTDATTDFALVVKNGTATNMSIAVCATDLTLLLGSTIADYIYSLETATAGSGIEKLKEWGFFTEDYYAYDAGSLQSVTGVSAHIMRDSDDNIIGNYPLDSSLTLRGIPKKDSNNKLYFDGDVYQSDGTVNRRYGVVDLGTLTWSYSTDSGHERFYATLSGYKFPGTGEVANIICSKYKSDTFVNLYNHVADKTIGLHISSNIVGVYDTAYSTAASFKTAVSGVYLVYELATPTTEQADPFAPAQICAEGGTEEYITTGIVPVGHNTKYPADLAGKLDSIPALPTTAGNYRLKVTVTGGVPSYEWVSA